MELQTTKRDGSTHADLGGAMGEREISSWVVQCYLFSQCHLCTNDIAAARSMVRGQREQAGTLHPRLRCPPVCLPDTPPHTGHLAQVVTNDTRHCVVAPLAKVATVVVAQVALTTVLAPNVVAAAVVVTQVALTCVAHETMWSTRQMTGTMHCTQTCTQHTRVCVAGVA